MRIPRPSIQSKMPTTSEIIAEALRSGGVIGKYEHGRTIKVRCCETNRWLEMLRIKVLSLGKLTDKYASMCTEPIVQKICYSGHIRTIQTMA
jgi:hypothetical protein